MNSENMVDIQGIDKMFYTHHFFQKDEETATRHFHTKKNVHAVNKISFGIKQGEVFGLLGPNGAGKTTTVKMISGLIRPSSGAVYVDGLEVERDRLKVLRKIGVVLEGTRTSIWPLTPLENLAYFGNLKNIRGKILKERSKQLLEFIGLDEKKDVQVRRLSRGQKQKLAICIALIADPPVILLDEPTTGLDVQSRRTIKDKIVEMTRNLGKSVLVTTHDMHVAQELCDRIGIVNEGKLIECKPTDQLINLFSDQVYKFHLDALPRIGQLQGLPGLINFELVADNGEPHVLAEFNADPGIRSEGFYALMERLKAEGFQIVSINQQQQSLESVFLRLTSKDDQTRETGDN